MFDAALYNELREDYINSGSKKALLAVRDYLDSVGYSMPSPKFLYQREKVETHKFLEDVPQVRTENRTYQIILNPEFKYWDLVA